jgi:hypothetical protein
VVFGRNRGYGSHYPDEARARARHGRRRAALDPARQRQRPGEAVAVLRAPPRDGRARDLDLLPQRDLYVEKISIQSGKYNDAQPGRPRFMPGLEIYGRELYEAPEWAWQRFLEYDPRAVIALGARSHEPSEGGIVDIDAFAAHCNEGGGGLELVR